MEGYRIKIIAKSDGYYSDIESFEEAQRIAEEESTDAYNRLKGRYSVKIECIEKC